jgi:hypothetical protein
MPPPMPAPPPRPSMPHEYPSSPPLTEPYTPAKPFLDRPDVRALACACVRACVRACALERSCAFASCVVDPGSPRPDPQPHPLSVSQFPTATPSHLLG